MGGSAVEVRKRPVIVAISLVANNDRPLEFTLIQSIFKFHYFKGLLHQISKSCHPHLNKDGHCQIFSDIL